MDNEQLNEQVADGVEPIVVEQVTVELDENGNPVAILENENGNEAEQPHGEDQVSADSAEADVADASA
jgi:hypothetical protein